MQILGINFGRYNKSSALILVGKNFGQRPKFWSLFADQFFKNSVMLYIRADRGCCVGYYSVRCVLKVILIPQKHDTQHNPEATANYQLFNKGKKYANIWH